jgi:O-antigen ligase
MGRDNNLPKQIWKQILELLDHSLFFTAIVAVMNCFTKLFSGSVARAAFRGPLDDAVLWQSVFVRVVSGFFGLFTYLRSRLFGPAYENSGWAAMMESFGALAEGSLAARLLSRFFGVSLEKPPKLNYLPLILALAVIIAVVVGCVIFPPLYVLAAAVAVIAALVVLAAPEIGIIAIAAGAPFLPTMVLAAGLCGVLACFLFKLLTDRRYAVTIDITGYAIIIYAALGLFVGVTSFTPGSSIKIAMLTAVLMLSFLLIVTLINSREKLYCLVFAFCTSAAFTGLYGLYQKISGKVDQTWVDTSLFSDISLRVYSTFENPNVYGTFLLLAIPLCLVMIRISRRWFAKAYYLIISLLLVYNLGYTYSRGCYLALCFGLVIFILFMEKRLIPILVAGIIALPFVIPASMLQRVMSITNLSDSSTSYRLYIWQATLRILKDFWVSGLGQGIDAYNTVYPFYAFNNVSAPHSHNLYLQVFVETGIAGLIVFLGLIVSWFRIQLGMFYKTRNTRTKLFIAAFMAAVAAFLFQGLFDYVFYNYRVMLSFFIFIGMAAAMVNIRNRESYC